MKSRVDWCVHIPCGGREDLSALTLAEYDEICWQRWRKAGEAARAAAGPQQAPALRAASTARDRYGWRGMIGTTWLGPQGGFHDAK